MRRLSALPATAFVLLAFAAVAAAASPFPTPVAGQSVYDGPGALQPDTVAALETEIDQIEARSGAEIAVLIQIDPTATTSSNQEAAKRLMDQWGVGRAGQDDGLVLLLSLQPNLQHGKISLYAGSGFKSAYLDEGGMADVIERDFTPLAANGDLDGAMRSMLASIDRSVAPGSRDRLERARLIDAVLGLVVAPVALLFTVALAYLGWRRQGRDPFFLDSPSVLMAGPPADLTPALATVVRNGRSDQRSVTTALMELASRKLIAFRGMDGGNGEEGPAVDVLAAQTDEDSLPEPEAYLLRILRAMAGPLSSLDREALARLHESLGDFHQLLEADAVRLGWFHEQPRRAIGRWMAIGVVELLAGGAALFAGLAVPIAGATALGAALLVGGAVTLVLAIFMSQRTPAGAMVDGMLRAYRRTLELTMAQARSMEQVVADETVRRLADTPDKAVVWGMALGLHRQVAALLERSLAERAAGTTSAGTTAWFPTWLGTGGFAAGSTSSSGGGSLFSASPIPNFAGMFATLGTIGSAPSGSGGDGGGGGFGGGSSSGGGGASGSF